MPRIDVSDGHDLVVRMSPLEMLGAFSGPIRVPLASVSAVGVEADPWAALRGIRAPGTGIPGVIAYGTRRYAGGRDFALVRGRAPAVRVDLDPGARYGRLLVTVPDPPATADRIEAALRHARPPA